MGILPWGRLWRRAASTGLVLSGLAFTAAASVYGQEAAPTPTVEAPAPGAIAPQPIAPQPNAVPQPLTGPIHTEPLYGGGYGPHCCPGYGYEAPEEEYDPLDIHTGDISYYGRNYGEPPEGCCDDADPDCRHLLHFFDDPCGRNHLIDNGYHIGGWIETGFTYNPDRPANDTNQPGVGFNDRANDLMLNQMYLIVSKDAGHDPYNYGLGFQMDFVAGSDARFTQAAGWDEWGISATSSDYWAYAMPQLYAELYAPVGNGLRVKFGHFYTIIGYEVVPAPDNFFYSHAYTMQYGEPFTHTGALATYDLNDNWSVSAGIHNGWDDFEDADANPYGFLGGISYTDCDEIWSVGWAMSFSEEANDLVGGVALPPPPGGGPAPPPVPALSTEADRYIQSIVATVKLTEKLSYVFQSDYGIQSQGAVKIDPTAPPVVFTENADWYGVNNYFFYTLSDTMSLGLRYEWFRDDDGVRVPNGSDQNLGLGAVQSIKGAPLPVLTGGNYHAVTLGVNWTPIDCILVRPEVRYDWSDVSRPLDNAAAPAIGGPGHDGVWDDLGNDDQWTFATDVILRF